MFKITNIQTVTNNSFKTIIDRNIPNQNEFNTSAATVTISNESQHKYTQSLKLKETKIDDELGEQFQKFYEAYHRAEAMQKRQLEQVEKEQSYNRLEDTFYLKSITYKFPKNTLEQTIKEALEGKVVNASIYAAELASAIRSSISMPDKSIEERTAYREIALQQAIYISKNYFENEEEASSFMNQINQYYANDILREKGFTVIDNSDIEPFKNNGSAISKDQNVSFYTLAKKYMDESYFERFMKGEGTAEESAQLLTQLQNNKEKYRNQIVKELELHEQQVEKQIIVTKKLVGSLVWKNGVISGNIDEQPSYLHAIFKWNQNMLKLFH